MINGKGLVLDIDHKDIGKANHEITDFVSSVMSAETQVSGAARAIARDLGYVQVVIADVANSFGGLTEESVRYAEVARMLVVELTSLAAAEAALRVARADGNVGGIESQSMLVNIVNGGVSAYVNLSAAIDATIAAQARLNTVMKANPILLIVSFVGAAIGAVSSLIQRTDDASRTTDSYTDSLNSASGSLDNLISKFRQANEVQREGLAIQWSEMQSREADKAYGVLSKLLSVTHSAISEIYKVGTGGGASIEIFQRFQEDAFDALDAGESLLPVIQDLAQQNGMSEEVVNYIKKLYVEMDAALSRKDAFGELLQMISDGSIHEGSREFTDTEIRLERQIALYGQVGEAAKLRYQIESGSLKDLAPKEKERLLDLAKQHDAIVRAADAEQERERGARQLQDAYESQLSQYERAIALTGDITEMERLRYEISSGSLKGLSEEHERVIFGLARQVDAVRNLEAAERALAEARRLDQQQYDRIDALAGQYMTEEELLIEHHERKLEELYRARNADMDNEQFWNEAIEEERRRHNDAVGALDNEKWKAQLAGTAAVFGQLTGLMSSESRKMFEIGKVAAIAQATLNIPVAASNAYASASSVPGVGHILAPIAAAAAVAAQLGQLHAIQGASFGGSGGAAAISGGAQAIPAAPAPVQLDGGSGAVGPQAPSIVVNVSGSLVGTGGPEELARIIGDRLSDEINNGDRLFIDVRSRNGRMLSGG